jgi:hypothetical protein
MYMSDYTPSPSFDFGAATGQGFNLPGGKSYLLRVAAWSAFIVVIIYAVLGMPIVKAFLAIFQNAIEMEHSLVGAEPDPAEVLAVMAPMFRAMGLISLIGLLQMAVFAAAEAAIYRNLFHREDRGIFPLMFGMDELRVFGTRLVIGFILGGLSVLAYLGVLLMGALIFTLATSLDSGILAALGGILIFAAAIAAIAAFVWIAIRLAPASAYTVKDRVFNPFASWAPMKGLVWPAIGSYLILYVVGYFILSFISLIIFLVFFLSSGVLGKLMQMDISDDVIPDFSALGEQLTSAGFILPLLIAIFLSLFLTLIWYSSMWALWGYLAKVKQTPYRDPQTWGPDGEV